MNFFKKNIGRHSQDELILIQAIEKIAQQNDIPESEIPECHTLEDLINTKLFLESYLRDEKELIGELTEPVEQVQVEQEHEQQQHEQSQNQPEAFQDQTFQDGQIENDSIDEPENDRPHFIADNYNPFSDPIIERSYTQQQTQENTQQADSNEEELELEESKNPALADLPYHTKRRAAEQTANTLLKGYAQLVPQPFKWLAKLPEQKIEKMAFDGEIDLSIEVSDGVTFDEYMRQTNAQMDELFEVDEDVLSDIREPLIEVLMEQNLELTPTQRLMAAIFSHLGQMLTVALKLRNQNNRILSYQQHLTHLSKGAKVA